MKKILKIVLYFILFVLLVLFITPFVFKGKIIELANQQINNTINADAHIENVSLSFFRKFPSLSIGLDELLVVGHTPFEGDTLIYLDRFELIANPLAMLTDKSIDVQKIILHNINLNAIILEDGTANWDIAKETGETAEEEPEDTTSSDFELKLALRLFSISNANISYTDESSDMFASLDNFNIDITGNMTKDYSTILVNSNCDAINFGMGAINYLTDVVFGMHIDIDANLKDNIYILQENNLSFNEFTLNWDGSVEMPDSNEIMFDLKYATSNTSFKTLLSLVPAVYTADFADLQTAGNLLLEGTVKGALIDDFIPDVDGKLVVSNANIQYPDLPKSVDNINIDIAYHVDGKQMDNTLVDVNKFHLELGENPVDLLLHLKTPISDPFIDGNLKLNIALGTLADVVPLENTTIGGNIKANIDMMGNLSMIENEQYEAFKADGQIAMNEISYISGDLSYDVKINNSLINFSPQYLDINTLKLQIGQSDIALSGKVSEYLPFVLRDETIVGELKLQSSYINLDELMASDSKVAEEETADTAASTPLEVIEVPKNINFSFNAKINQIDYELMDITDLAGIITVKNGIVSLNKLSLDALEGNLLITGEYNTQDIDNPLVDFGIQATGIDIPMTASTFTFTEKIAPVIKQASGKVSLGVNLTTFLQSDMKPVLSSLLGEGNLSSDKIGITETPVMNSLNSALKTNKFEDMILEDIALAFEIAGGKLMLEPFEFNIGDANFLVGGNQSFDNQLDYDVNISIPSSSLGVQDWTSSINSIASSQGLSLSSTENLNIGAKVTGDMKDPKVSLDWKKTMGSSNEAIKKEIKQNVQAKVEQTKEEAKVKARAEADKILKEAEKEADLLRTNAEKAADAVRKEANANADKLVKEAKNPVAKIAAQESAKKVKSQGEAKAKKLEDEADDKANVILKAAQEKADKLLK